MVIRIFGQKMVTAALLLWAFVLPVQAADPQRGFAAGGPLVTRNLYAYYLPFINLSPGSARTIAPGYLQLSIANSYTNTLRWDPGWVEDKFIFQTDLESYLLSFQLDLGIRPHWEFSMMLYLCSVHGGFLDPLLQGFHDLFNFANQDRESVADNAFLIHVENENGTWIDLDTPLFGIGDIALAAKLNLLQSTDFLLSLRTALKMPTGGPQPLFSSGKIDLAVHLLADMRLGRFVFYLNGGWLYLGTPDDLRIFDFRNHIFGYAFCCEWILVPPHSIVVQIDGRTSPFSSGQYFLDHHCSTLNAGLSLRLDEKKVLQLSLIEEFLAFSNVECGVHLGMVIEGFRCFSYTW